MIPEFLNYRRIAVVASVVAVVSLLAVLGSPVQASNMGFKMNRAITGLAAGQSGENDVALPFRNPYVTAQDICNALNLTGTPASPGPGQVTQIDPVTGATDLHICGNAAPFPLVDFRGIQVFNDVDTSGILVGSHNPNAGPLQLFPLAQPPRKGDNFFPVPYHTTAATSQDICEDFGLAPGTSIIVNKPVGAPNAFFCNPPGNPAGAFPLVIGETVLIQFSGGAAITLAAGKPSHF